MGCHNGAANTFTHVECVFDFAQVQLLAMYLDLIVTSSHVAYAPVGIAPGDAGTFYDDFTRNPYRGHLADIVLGGDPDGAANRLPDARGKGATQDDATDGGHHSCLALAPSVEKARAIRPNADGLGVDGLTPDTSVFRVGTLSGESIRITVGVKMANSTLASLMKLSKSPSRASADGIQTTPPASRDPRARPPADALAEGLEDGGQVAVLNYHALRLAGAAAGE
ncbi:hypothetical protein PG995_005656 [Apiospora arundinis]